MQHSMSSRFERLVIKDEGFVFDPHSGESFTLNKIGLLVLRGLMEGKRAEYIASDISDHFFIDMRESAADVRDFLEQLRALNLLEAAP